MRLSLEFTVYIFLLFYSIYLLPAIKTLSLVLVLLTRDSVSRSGAYSCMLPYHHCSAVLIHIEIKI